MSSPLVSIIIPMYNQRADFLKECLESAINQTYSNIEVVVSDNHSTNEAIGVLEKIPKDRLKIIRPPQHLNMIDHFIFAGSAAAGEYITFLSSDDLLYPDCITEVVQPLIENKSLCFSYCENAIIDEKSEKKLLVRKLRLPSGTYRNRQIAFRMYNYLEYWIIGGVIRNEYYKQVGLVKNILLGDWLLGFQLLKYGDVAYCNKVLSAIRFHERLGDAKQVYADAHVLHNTQRATRHQLIIEDKGLLDAIGISQKQAISYRNREVLGAVIVLIRQYHKHELNKETVNRIFEVYKQTGSGFHFNFLTRNYTSKLALAYTYMLGVKGRISKIFSSKK